MARSETIFLAIGGGNLAGCQEVLDEIFGFLAEKKDPRLVVMTVATNIANGTSAKYNSIFRKRGVSHVEVVNIWQREDAFSKAAMNKIERAHALFFTGGDQKNVTGLMGGSPLDQLLRDKADDGILIAGTSAGAAMMSGSMIIGGSSETAPRVGCVEMSPGMNFIDSTVIDTHFSQRGRHGRLLTAVAHHPQLLGLGLDENTAIRVVGEEFRVLGDGCVTVIDARQMDYSDLVYKRPDEVIGMFGVHLHVLPRGHSYDIQNRKPCAPKAKGLPR
ncbi:MAG TPA: cyanophycinase [Pyrinomonadaceae bacterium]|jgi:cyanophycinase|nr:cyanophycinase [Pyrinomonadaceae bacterium]